MMHTNLGTRMKENYEFRFKSSLMRRTPVVIRLDGRCFHSLKKHLIKPFDTDLHKLMCFTASELVSEIQGAKFAYVASDEISILVVDYDKFETQAFFDYDIQKITSTTAGIASSYFSNMFRTTFSSANVKYITFDSRCFNLPREEVNNYFVWRQKDWYRNSVSMTAQHYFSTVELHGQKCEDMKFMLERKGISWDALDPIWKYGSCITKGYDKFSDDNIVIDFTKVKEFVEAAVYPKEEEESK